MKVSDVIQYMNVDEKFLEWPPDVFAVVMTLLQKSGAYTRAVSVQWPPPIASSHGVKDEQPTRTWAQQMRDIGAHWREAAIGDETVPTHVIGWWKQILGSEDTAVDAIAESDDLCAALLQLCAVADEASAGVGLSPSRDDYDLAGWLLLDRRGTLSRAVDPSIVRVLPKCHTPQVGMTLRSLSHHLGLCATGDIQPKWYVFERTKPAQPRHEQTLNLLLIPWPRTMLPGDFRGIDGPLKNMSKEQFGFFTCEAQHRIEESFVDSLLKRAQKLVPAVDGVILPELSLDAVEYERLRRAIVENGNAFLMAGVGRAAEGGAFGQNSVRFDAPVKVEGVANGRAEVEPQHKHHRWCLSAAQIGQYGLGRALDPKKIWWECVDITDRKLAFVSLEPWLTLSVLICEDLARQDPVAELVRCVGPNLVISLLMDGPQLAERWSARYATVLADDPGSSVLTLTNVGMVDLCRGPRRVLASRPVALWKDALTGGPYELNLPADADALLLCLGSEYRAEWSADGRSDVNEDGGMTGYLTLLCVHPISSS